MKYQLLACITSILVSSSICAANQCADVFNGEYISRPFDHAKLSLVEKKQLVTTTLNLDMFFVARPDSKRFPDVVQSAPMGINSKSIKEIQAYRKVLSEIDADVYIFQEVIGSYSTQALDPKGEYLHLQSKTSDESGSHTAFLVRKTLQASAKITYPNSTNDKVMPRGMPVLNIRAKNSEGKVIAPDRPDLLIMGVHLKSQRGLVQVAYDKIKAREMQALKTAYKELKVKYNDAPLMITGDFNVDLMRDPHAIHLRKSLVDSIELTHPDLGEKDRVTQVYIDEANGVYSANQMDGALVSPSLATKLIDSFVRHYRNEEGEIKVYKDGRGNILPFPTDRRSRNQEISDHIPVVTVIGY